MILIYFVIKTYKSFEYWYLKSRIGETKISLNKNIFIRGEDIKYNLFINSTKRMKINNINVILEKLECCRHTDINDNLNQIESVKSHLVFQDNILNSKKLTSKDSINFNGQIRIPYEEMHTFCSDNNDIKWRVRVQIDIASCPDGILIYDIELLP